MKIFKKLLIVALVLSLALGLFACKKNNAGGDDSDSNVNVTDKSTSPVSFLDYAVVRAAKISDTLVDGVSDMYMKLTALSGENNSFSDDYLNKGQEPDSEAKEILIGNTNRPETAEILSQLANNEYAVAVVGKKIIIAGYVDSMTDKALAYFVENYLGDGADGKVPGDLFYKGSIDVLTIIDKNEPKYSIVRNKDLAKEIPEEVLYNKNETDILDQMYVIADAIKEVSGIDLPIKTDRLNFGYTYDDSTTEILFADTLYPQTEAVRSKLSVDDYAVCLEGNKLVIYGFNIEGIRKATSAFVDMLENSVHKDSDGKVTLVIPKSFVDADDGSLGYFSDVPTKAGDRRYDKVVNCHDGAVMLYWEDATLDMMSVYASSIEALGYTVHQSLDNASIKSVSYVKDKVLVHIYLTKTEKELRVIAQDNATLAVNPYEYEKLCDVSVTQLGSTSGIGMSYLVRLEDGTFVIIDGGYYSKEAAEHLLDVMNEQKPEGVTKLVVSAWFLTHQDGDHVGLIDGFIKAHNKDLTVKMLIGNQVSDYVMERAGSRQRTFNYQSVNGKLGGCVYKKAYTGEQFFLPGMTFTILANFWDLYPGYPTSELNNTSVVFDGVTKGEMLGNSPADDQTRFIWLGDAQNAISQVIYRMYGSSLKCDVLQVGHHGNKNAGCMELYQACDPSVAFWPTLDIADNSHLSAAHNAWLLANVDISYWHGTREAGAELGTPTDNTITFPEVDDMSNIAGDKGEEGDYTKVY